MSMRARPPLAPRDVAAHRLGLAPRLFDHVAVALAWRYLTHAAMLGLAMCNELRPAASLADPLLALVPRQAWVAQHNYHLWLLAYVPLNLALWRLDRRRFVHFLWLGGVLSLVRGVTIVLTGLGPVDGHDLNAGLDGTVAFAAWLRLVNPLSALGSDVAHVYLTKDLFFSGHTATTMALALYCHGLPRLRALGWAAHALVVASVFFAHLHYTVDVVGAWLITAAAFALGWRLLPIERLRASAPPRAILLHRNMDPC